MEQTIRFRVNERPVELTVDNNRMLLWVLRTDLGLTGTKYGCGEALCGACTVLVDGEAVRSCRLPVSEVAARNVTTIEGLAKDGRLHTVQEAFIKHDALQCGFCTPGMILTAHSLLLKNSNPSRETIIEYMDGNLCRCGSYERIVQAILAASEAERGVSK